MILLGIIIRTLEIDFCGDVKLVARMACKCRNLVELVY